MRFQSAHVQTLCTVLFVVCVQSIAVGVRGQVAIGAEQAARLEAENLSDQEIQWAIDAIVDGLIRLQNQSGTWEKMYADASLAHINAHISGETTLATLALLGSGISYQDPRLAATIDFLKTQHPEYTYVRSLRAHVWALLPDRFEGLLERDSNWLLRAYGFDSGSWAYTDIPMQSGYDNSLTQYGLLGLWEAAKRDVEVPRGFWKRVEEHFLRTQLQDGGWNYRPQYGVARGSMTAAGLTCLFITQDYLNAQEYLKPGLSGTKPQIAMDKGLRWLDANFAVDRHPGMGDGETAATYLFYYLYGIERVGLASGYKRFGGHDWFREGAAEIIERLCEPIVDPDSGELVGLRVRDQVRRTGTAETPVIQLSFGLMFLSHGRVPIVVSKVRDDGFAWNNRPRDAARMASWIGQETEGRRSWQVLDMARPIEEWFDGPMVYLASHEAPGFVQAHRSELARRADAQRRGLAVNAEQTTVERIKRYLDLGGLLLTNSDDGAQLTSEAVRELGREMYPDYEWRTVEKEHAVYSLSSPVERLPALEALSNGVRELIIHCPQGDLGAALQVNDVNKERDVFNTIANVYFYASERGLTRPRLDRKLSLTDAEVVHGVQASGDPGLRSVVILRGAYRGNWNPEPASDELLTARLRDRRNLDATIRQVKLIDVGQPGLAKGAPLLIVRGTGSAAFDDREMEAVEKYISGGGVVLFESAGGMSDFGALAEKRITEAFGGGQFRRPLGHAVLSGAGLPTGVDCSEVAYRLYSLERLGGREVRPRLRAFRAPRGSAADGDGQPSIFVSREDLCHALLGQPRWGIHGYRKESAADLMGNLVEYAMERAARAR